MPDAQALPPLPDLLEAVREITRRAGDMALGAMAQVEGEIKEDMTFVTAVDRQVEQFLRRELEAVAPDVGFLGEEYGRHGDTADRLWIVDPIDGTGNLVFGLPSWGISVGLVEHGESILGVFHLPITHETFYAIRGGGAFMNGTRIHAQRERSDAHTQHSLGITSDCINPLDLSGIETRFRALGSITTEIVYAARGSFYACISFGDKLVDLGAAVCIAKEAGCEWTYLSGDPFKLQEWIDGPARKEPLIIGPLWAIDELRAKLKAK